MELRPDGHVLRGEADAAQVVLTAGLPVFGIGYQGRSPAAFLDVLSTAGVKLLVDVRERAWSQRPPYRKTALAEALATRGIGYEHLKAAGNPFRPKAGDDVEWRDCKRLYSAHLRAHPEVVGALGRLVAAGSAALFCYEGERSMCHRGVLLAALKRRWLVEVVDL